MNAERRKHLSAICELLNDAKARLEEAAQEERDYFDEMPESFQNSDRGERASEAADTLEEAVDSLDDLVTQIEEAMQ